MSRRPRIVIDASIEPDGSAGGIQQVLIGLASGFNELAEAGELELEILFVTASGCSGWLREYTGQGAGIVELPAPAVAPRERFKQMLGPLRAPVIGLARALKRAAGIRPQGMPPGLVRSSGFAESLQPDLIHHTYPPHYVATDVRSVCTLYDLQHVHLPEYFDADHYRWREVANPQMIAQCVLSSTISDFTLEDVVRQYGVDRSRLRTIRLAPVNPFYPVPTPAQVTALCERLALPERFLVFPAVTYPHKNHLRLLQALALLRDQGLVVPLVAPGSRRLAWDQIRAAIDDLRLGDQVMFPGFLEPGDLRALYKRAQALVFPSLFEGAGLPVIEAFVEGLPVICSDIPAIREYGGQACGYFDPLSPESIGAAIVQVWNDGRFAQQLRQLGHTQSQQFSWRRTAREYAQLYVDALNGKP